MDSKLRRLTIFLVMIMIMLILGTVAAIEVYKKEKRQAFGQQNAEETVEEEPDLYAFMRDETFFDKEPTRYEKLLAGQGKKLTLAATSVERDLRVQVLNDLGELVTGQPLYITVNGEEYKDLDQDGILYVGDLKPGDYQVSLNELEGYKVPSEPLSIHVKNQVEYTPIEDISLLIKTEADINAEAEDSAVNGAEDDADKTEQEDILESRGNRSFGIDVSKWNKEINWEKVKASGVDFAIIRCGYRGSVTGTLVEDPYFYKNLEGAKKAGIKVGLYFFTQATSVVEAVEEASMVLCLNNGGALDYPVFIDTEGAGGNGRADGLDVATRTAVCQAFCETIENAGYYAGVYSSRNWLNGRLDTAKFDTQHVIWLAEYRDQPEYRGKYQLWQYTSSGTIDGIDGRVDFNVSYWSAPDSQAASEEE